MLESNDAVTDSSKDNSAITDPSKDNSALDKVKMQLK